MVGRRPRGLSLVEVFVFSVILFGLMIIFTSFLVKGKRYSRQTESYGFAQREATKIIRRVSDDLYTAAHEHLRIEPNRFFFLSSRPLADEPPVEFDPNTGGTLWKRWVHYSYDATERAVLRSHIDLDHPTSDLTTVPEPMAEFDDFLTLPAGDVRPIGVGVESFFISPVGDAVYTVRVKTRYNGSSAKTDPNSNFAEVALTATIRLPKNN